MGPNPVTAIIPYQLPYQPIDFYDLVIQEKKNTLKSISEELNQLDILSIECFKPDIYKRVKQVLKSIFVRFSETMKGFENDLPDVSFKIYCKIDSIKMSLRAAKTNAIDRTARTYFDHTTGRTYFNPDFLWDNGPERPSSPIREYYQVPGDNLDWVLEELKHAKDLIDKGELPNSEALGAQGYDNAFWETFKIKKSSRYDQI